MEDLLESACPPAPGHPAGAADAAGTAGSRAAVRRNVAAVALGNAVEFFDFGAYATFAVMIGHTFFPAKSPFVSLLLSVSVFGLGFVVRPLGALVIGAYADRAGRKPAMMLTLVMMAVGTGAIAVLPGYETIGVAAPILLVVTRLIQGLAWGGEAGPATTYILEAAPPERRGAYACWQVATQGFAGLAAGLAGYALTLALPEADLYAWGWRVPFALGLMVLPIGVYIRRRLSDTIDAHRAYGSTRAILHELNARHRRPIAVGLMILLGSTITQYFLNYMTTFALTELHLPGGVAMLATFATGAALAVGSLAGGSLSDRVGRRAVLIWPRVLLLLLIFPALQLIVSRPTPAVFLATLTVLSGLHGMSGAALIVLIAESFPQRVRSTGFSIVYAVAVSLFGGTAQSIVTWLIGTTGNPMAPAGYLLVANAICIAAGWLAVETWPRGRNTR
ncbi:MFS transporter [Burkholderia thailandensis]|nr:MFS transporter [Burkholderia thailandensis]AHI65661.1 sugar (and other) transporter family protein [Burkholderia thailandensis H0587]AIP62347.1 major facilitator transporter [Burkholderia thailandensis]AOI52437.1 MFS transporter [Burkholderia thailandensis]AOJ51418.1 MFS transporter [Burkholderia thailandensis]AVR23759.1 MFS transporter [Burkholderia thailandensis]